MYLPRECKQRKNAVNNMGGTVLHTTILNADSNLASAFLCFSMVLTWMYLATVLLHLFIWL